MERENFITSKHRLPLLAVVVTSVLCIAISIFSLQSGWFIIFQNLYYVPIIISCFYYTKRGFIFSVLLACIYFLLILSFTNESSIILQAAARVLIFILIAGVITYLSVLNQRTEGLRIASAYNRSLIETSLDSLVVIGVNGKITDVNPTTEEVIGYTRTELIGTEFQNYFIEHEQARAGYQEVLGTGSVRNLPLELRHRDGHVTPVLYNGSVLRDKRQQIVGVFVAVRDITERKQAEKALQESEERFRSYFELGLIGMAITSPTKHFIEVNDKICQIS